MEKPAITGYRVLSADEILLVNTAKELERKILEAVEALRLRLDSIYDEAYDTAGPEALAEVARLDVAQPHRWLAIARTRFQEGFMALNRSITQPST